MSSLSLLPSTRNTTFWRVLQTQTKWLVFESVIKHHLGLKAQNIENPVFIFGCFSLKSVYNSCKLQGLLQVEKYLFMHTFTHANIAFLFRHLPTEFVIFINVCCQMKCFSGISFSFFYEQILLILNLVFWFHMNVKQGIHRH